MLELLLVVWEIIALVKDEARGVFVSLFDRKLPLVVSQSIVGAFLPVVLQKVDDEGQGVHVAVLFESYLPNVWQPSLQREVVADVQQPKLHQSVDLQVHVDELLGLALVIVKLKLFAHDAVIVVTKVIIP